MPAATRAGRLGREARCAFSRRRRAACWSWSCIAEMRTACESAKARGGGPRAWDLGGGGCLRRVYLGSALQCHTGRALVPSLLTIGLAQYPPSRAAATILAPRSVPRRASSGGSGRDESVCWTREGTVCEHVSERNGGRQAEATRRRQVLPSQSADRRSPVRRPPSDCRQQGTP
jgi:hypothetical protein